MTEGSPVVPGRDGAGWPKQGSTILAVTSYGGNGIPAYFGIVNGHLVEAPEMLDDGTPDWPNAGVISAAGGADEAFAQAAYALLHYYDRSRR